MEALRTLPPRWKRCCTNILATVLPPHYDMSVVAFTAGSLGDILAATALIVKIVRTLHDSRDGDSSDECKALELELQSLYKILILSDFAIRRYKSTPLGEDIGSG
jgi:hypothetical protein